MDENELRTLLADSAGALRPDAVRPLRALYAGQRQRRRRAAVRFGSSLAVFAVTTASAAFLLSRPEPPAAVAAIDCGRTAAPQTIRVAVRDTGLPLLVRNASNSVAQLRVAQQGAAVAPGEDEFRLAVPPGRHKVTCTTDAGARTVATIDVVDDQDLWSHGAVLGCAYPQVYDVTDKFLLGDGEPSDLTRTWLGPQPNDAVRTVGYTEASTRMVAVLRNDRTVALATWHELLPGTWTLGVVRICSGSVQPPPTSLTRSA